LEAKIDTIAYRIKIVLCGAQQKRLAAADGSRQRGLPFTLSALTGYRSAEASTMIAKKSPIAGPAMAALRCSKAGLGPAMIVSLRRRS